MKTLLIAGTIWCFGFFILWLALRRVITSPASLPEEIARSDRATILLYGDVIYRSQEVLTKYLAPDNTDTPEQTISKLLDILDHGHLVQVQQCRNNP